MSGASQKGAKMSAAGEIPIYIGMVKNEIGGANRGGEKKRRNSPQFPLEKTALFPKMAVFFAESLD